MTSNSFGLIIWTTDSVNTHKSTVLTDENTTQTRGDGGFGSTEIGRGLTRVGSLGTDLSTLTARSTAPEIVK